MDPKGTDIDLLDGQFGQVSLVEDAPSITCLPAELLLGIFVLAVHTPTFIEIPRHPTKKLPWILGQVCSGWRRLAYSDPSLWKHFDYTISGHFQDPLLKRDRQQSLRRLHALLPYGLESLKIKLYSLQSTSPITFQHPPLSTLTKLHLELSLASMLKSLDTFSSYFTNLEELGLIAADYTEPHDCLPALKLLDVFSVTKRVSKLTFGSGNHSTGSLFLHIPNIPWSQLIQLDLSQARLHPHRLFRVLCECVVLRDLSLQTWSTRDAPYVAHRPFLCELKSLTVHSTQHMANILWPFPWKQLKSLKFHNIFVSCIKRLLIEAPEVESLSVIKPFGPQYLMEGSPLLMKSLCSLTFQYRGNIYLDPDSFLDHLLTDHIIAPNLEALHLLRMSEDQPFKVPPARILPFVENTQGHLTQFRFDHPVIQDINTPDSYLRDVVRALRSVREFTAPHMFFNRRLLNEMKQSHLLPKVQRLEIRVSSTVTFAIMVETRLDKSMKEEGFIRLKRAYAYYPESYHTVKLRDESKALGRLKGLNASYGTEFGLIAVGVKGRGREGRFLIREDYL